MTWRDLEHTVAPRIAVFSVVHPLAEPFFDDFLDSLESQTDQDFRVFLVDAGASALGERLADRQLNVTIHAAEGSPTAVRRQGIMAACRENIDWLIFLDSDDYCAPDRVARCRQSIAGADILFFDAVIFGKGIDKPISLLTRRFEHAEQPEDILPHANFLGLSTTAARLKAVRAALDTLPDDLIAFDWALFTRMVLAGSVTRYVRGSPTWYRQHQDNIAGIFDLSDEQIRRGVAIKARHYALFRDAGALYARLAEAFAVLQRRIETDDIYRESYCQAVRKAAPSIPLWWESMKLPEELPL